MWLKFLLTIVGLYVFCYLMDMNVSLYADEWYGFTNFCVLLFSLPGYLFCGVVCPTKKFKLKLYRFLGTESAAHARARIRKGIKTYAEASARLNWIHEGG